jgi:hypothetical protein
MTCSSCRTRLPGRLPARSRPPWAASDAGGAGERPAQAAESLQAYENYLLGSSTSIALHRGQQGPMKRSFDEGDRIVRLRACICWLSGGERICRHHDNGWTTSRRMLAGF